MFFLYFVIFSIEVRVFQFASFVPSLTYYFQKKILLGVEFYQKMQLERSKIFVETSVFMARSCHFIIILSSVSFYIFVILAKLLLVSVHYPWFLIKSFINIFSLVNSSVLLMATSNLMGVQLFAFP